MSFNKPSAAPPPKFTPKPFVWKDPKTLPLRDWLYGKYLIRKYVSVDVAPGGMGKSSHTTAEMLAMASGKPLLGIAPKQRLKVWLWNLEDAPEEIEMRIAAAALHYELTPADLEGYLFVNHGRDTPLVIAASDSKGLFIAKPIVDALVDAVVDIGADVVIADPFVSSHRVTENDNVAIDMVVKEWGRVGENGNCAIRLTHHARKGEQEVTADSSRGASAIVNAGRVVRVFNRMTKEEAGKAGIEDERYRSYYRTYIDKQNMAPPSDKSDWFHLKSVNLGNGPFGTGDAVGVTTPWEWPEMAAATDEDFRAAAKVIRAGRWRENSRSPEWVGNAIAQALDIQIDTKVGESRCKAILASWLKDGRLLVVDGLDSKSMSRKFVEVAR